MNKIILKIKREVAENFIPIAKVMRSEGADDSEILRTLRNHIDLKIRHFYRKAKEPTAIGKTIKNTLLNPPDSRAEVAFLTILDESNISFRFQYKIGPYRVDFLIGDSLILELDGPHHSQQKEYDEKRDKYLQDMGYKVLRIPIWAAANDSKAIVESIREILNE